MSNPGDALFSEARSQGNPFRATFLEEVRGVLDARRGESAARREAFFRPSFVSLGAYEESTHPLRERVVQALGWPLNGTPVAPPEGDVVETLVAEDTLGSIYRLQIPVLGPLHCYGLYFVPKGNGPFRLVISQHGGLGKPEETAGLFDTANYNRMTRRIVERGYAVFAPQLLLTWDEEFGPKYDQQALDIAFKQVGGSMAALQIYMIQRVLDVLLCRKEIEGPGAAMVGLSYGGFYTLATTACDARIRTAVSSCFINDRLKYGWQDWTWFDSANHFLDREWCALVCPRPLYLEAGRRDDLFDIASAREVAASAGEIYGKLQISDRFAFEAFDGTHEFNPGNTPLDFLVKHFPPLSIPAPQASPGRWPRW